MELVSPSNAEKLQEEFVSADVISASEDEEDQTKEHVKLLEAISSLDNKKRRKLSNRTEASTTISEFNLTEVGKEKVKLHELLASLKETQSHVTVKKQLHSVVKRKKVLPVPLNPEEEEKIRRGIEYKKVCAEVSKWDSIVEANRTAEQLIFPLKQPDISIRPAAEFIKKFQPKTALEIEISNILNSSDNVLTKDSVLTPAEEKALQSLSLEEAKIRHENLQKARALLSYQEAKFRRQKKIKSKKYHRILKHQRLKEHSKEFEKLQKTNPKLAMEELEKLDKLRILERMTLKHKNTGKWAKQRMLRAKHDPNLREALSRQLELSNQLTQKINPPSDNDENSEADNDSDCNNQTCENTNEKTISSFMDNNASHNKWQKQASHSLDMEKVEPDEDDIDCDTLQVTFHPVKSANKDNSILKKKVKNKLKLVSSNSQDKGKEVSFADQQYKEARPLVAGKPGLHYTNNHECENDDGLIVESLERKQSMEDFDIPENEHCKEKTTVCSKLNSIKQNKKKKKKKQIGASLPKKDPKSFLDTKTTTLKSVAPDITTTGEDSLDDNSDEEERITIQEACEDEELFGQFREEKRAAIEKDKPETINNFLPGWGSWAGPGIRISSRKKKRFIIKPPPANPRKDGMLGNVIINAKQNEKLKKHKVSDVPFPFVSVQQFESSVRQPIGNTWNPETAFQRLIAPKIVTRLGKVIDPIDDSTLVKIK